MCAGRQRARSSLTAPEIVMSLTHGPALIARSAPCQRWRSSPAACAAGVTIRRSHWCHGRLTDS
jgi:hypothetical protein